MYTLVKINDDSLHLRILYDDAYLTGLENFLAAHGFRSPLFVTPHIVGGEFDVLVQCDVVQALRNLYGRWVLSAIGTASVPEGVYLKGANWYVDAAIGVWVMPPRQIGAGPNKTLYPPHDHGTVASAIRVPKASESWFPTRPLGDE